MPYVNPGTRVSYRARMGQLKSEPSFFGVALCFVLMLCAHALCFVLRAHALCLLGFLVTARQAQSTKHEACAPRRWPAAAWQTLLLTKIGSFCRARPSIKHKA
jgi:hypothetical protein